MTRPDVETYGMMLAQVASLRATCLRAKVGAVIFDANNRVLSAGYNGSPPGMPHCCDDGCLMFGNHCARCIHAEMNALKMISFNPPPGSVLFCTHLPCHTCSHLTVACGIRTIYFASSYGPVGGAAILQEATGARFIELG